MKTIDFMVSMIVVWTFGFIIAESIRYFLLKKIDKDMQDRKDKLEDK